MSEQIRQKKERFSRFLKWLDANPGSTNHQCEQWFFENYALGEKTRRNYLKDLVKFSFVRMQGSKMFVRAATKALFDN